MDNRRRPDAVIDLERLPHYALFALVVARQSMSQAARETGLTRSGVSQRIRRLEEEVGRPLLRRTTRRVVPTPHGVALLDACSRLLVDLDAIRNASARGAAEEPLRVNAPGALARWLPHAVSDFVAKSAGPVRLTFDSRFVDLLGTEHDVIVRVARAVPESVVARRLFEDRIVVTASPGYLARHGAPASPHDLLRHACLRYLPAAFDVEWRFRVGRRDVVVPVKPAFASDDGDALVALASLGHGLVVTPTFMVADEVRRGALVRVLEEARAERIVVWAVLPEGRRSPRRALAFADALARNLPARVPRLG